MPAPARRKHSAYVFLCTALSRTHPHARAGKAREGLLSDLELAGIEIDPRRVAEAARMLALGSGSVLASLLVVSLLLGEDALVLPLALGAAAVPLTLREALLRFPSGAAGKRASEVLKDSTHATNLMIMSLGHEPSLSKAILFASRDKNSFSEELRRCVWSVVMGTCASFEDSLLELGSRWARFSGELKATMNAMVTASCESTEDGKRRALDRANNAMMMGAKRRIEEYAMSLSAPSMVMFGLGILLPLMVGSFLPMLSWNLWSFEGLESDVLRGSGGSTVQTAFVMNILFPAIALLVATSAVSHQPLETRRAGRICRPRWKHLLGAFLLSATGVALAASLLDGHQRAAAVLLVAAMPPCVVAILEGVRGRTGTPAEDPGFEDALFVVGARMLEGENFEAALERAASDLEGRHAKAMSSLSFRSNVVGQDFDSAVDDEAGAGGRSNALEAFKIVREAAAKDEGGAGLLAMDLAAYIKDLRDLEQTLKGRLRPTISMMRMTAYALGPVVMGVTYAIYVSMGSMMGGGQGGLDPSVFMLILGAFLAETGVIVCYFVWGIEGKEGVTELMASVGSCVLVSELVFAATSFMASR